MDKTKAKVGVFAPKNSWQHEYCINFFTEMLSRSGKIEKEVVYKDLHIIENEHYRVEIYYEMLSDKDRGKKFDMVFNYFNNEDQTSQTMITNSTNFSKFSNYNK